MSPFEGFSYIYGAARTPIGKFGGALSAIPAPALGAVAIKEAVKRSGVPAERISEVIMGNVLSAGIGQAPARQAAIKSGLPHWVGATTVNKVCGSGLKAVMLADNAIRLEQAEFVVAGGMENMSLAPLIVPNGRKGYKLGNVELIDSLVHDGLWDSFENCHMGDIAEKLAGEEKYGREAQDQFALESYRRAREAQDHCLFQKELVAVPVSIRGKQTIVDKDEQPHANDLKKLLSLPPAFKKADGTITAGNASKINDGAAALVLGPYSETLKPAAKIVDHVTHAESPDQFPIAPVKSIEKLLGKWSLELDEIDLFEINEAFSISTIAVCDRLGLDRGKVNVNGGAVALGHPIGASGARILVTLLYALQARSLKKGLVALCLGGGESLALGIEIVGHN
ncbi:acetyl-CoA acetyltransferase [Candidatus Nitromaritima sp. SCGC AAA799-A02]|nr:acetyl-CoA acetyltransferase [Candidatus Nitromaritima sp. SCGC AAA799-C22]KMP12389.1 acetyl-CoA acetyltransferase [Candidatus Nitromaritima sp. SCGC AAA799-A02]